MSNKKLPLVFDTAVLEDPNGWLDDEHITAAQHLLQEQHPDVAGLQSTSLQYTRTFEVHRDHPFIQCLHENGNHNTGHLFWTPSGHTSLYITIEPPLDTT